MTILKIEAAVYPLVLSALCLLATGSHPSPALGLPLPLNTPLNIRNEANDRWLSTDPVSTTVAAGPGGVALELNLLNNLTQWQFLKSGRPGQVLIAHVNTGFILDADPALNDTDPAPVKLVIATTLPTQSQMWRIIETGTGPYLIEHVQTGLLLDAEVATLNSVNNRTNMRLLGRDDSIQNNRQWRFYPDTARLTPLQAVGPFRTNSANLVGKNPKLSVTAKLQGSGLDRLTAELSSTIEDPGTGQIFATPRQSFPIKLDDGTTVATGKKILLIRVLKNNPPSFQTLSYSDPDGDTDILAGKINLPTVNNRVARFDSTTAKNFVDTTTSGIFNLPPPTKMKNIISFCFAVGDSGPNPNQAGVQVILEQQRFVVDVP